MGFSQALSGLNSAASNLDVVSNNIANSQTVGFKAAKTQFADVYASAKIGLGVSVSGVVQNFGSGNLDTTGRGLDLAISGEGFFKFEQAGQVIYSRNGQLTLTPDGYLENAQGGRLMGEQAALLIPSGQMAAKATEEIKSVFNLKSSSDVITATPLTRLIRTPSTTPPLRLSTTRRAMPIRWWSTSSRPPTMPGLLRPPSTAIRQGVVVT